MPMLFVGTSEAAPTNLQNDDEPVDETRSYPWMGFPVNVQIPFGDREGFGYVVDIAKLPPGARFIVVRYDW